MKKERELEVGRFNELTKEEINLIEGGHVERKVYTLLEGIRFKITCLFYNPYTEE